MPADALTQAIAALDRAGVATVPARGAARVVAVIDGPSGPHFLALERSGRGIRISAERWRIMPRVPSWLDGLDSAHPPVRTTWDAATGELSSAVHDLPPDTAAGGGLLRALTALVETVEDGRRRGDPSDPGGCWRDSGRRDEAIATLAEWGRMLTAEPIPTRRPFHQGNRLLALQKNLIKMRRPHALLLGHPGTGKTSLVRELARTIARDPESLLPALRDRDVFELSVNKLRGGSAERGSYESRMAVLIDTLSANPEIILFIDEVHQLLSSAMHDRSVFSQGDQAFKQALGDGRFAVIGATTLAEYRHFIEPDGALVRRFGILRLDPPTPTDTLRILRQRRTEFEAHYGAITVTDPILRACVEQSEKYLPARHQPDKALDLLDEACAEAQAAGVAEVGPTHVDLALAEEAGRPGSLDDISTEAVRDHLAERIVGQGALITKVAERFVGRLADPWLERRGPRGCWVFCGPTGTGKTETAAQLAGLLGSGRVALIRIDCNTLGRSPDPGQAISRLIGVSRGFVGYSRGEGGLLSAIRHAPESIVLFDEIEKAHPVIADVLLQLMDEGQVTDVDGNVLDFRRAFVIFTTNAGGSQKELVQVGFTPSGDTRPRAASPAASRAALVEAGFSEPFLARIDEWFAFQPLNRDAGVELITRRLTELASAAALRGFRLCWEPSALDRLLDGWSARGGARFAMEALQGRVNDHLLLIERAGDLDGVRTIRLECDDGAVEIGGMSSRRDGDTLVLGLS